MKEGRCSLCNADIAQPLLLRELTDCPRCQIRATATWQLDLENGEIERRHQDLEHQRVIVGLVACGEANAWATTRPGTSTGVPCSGSPFATPNSERTRRTSSRLATASWSPTSSSRGTTRG